MPRATLIVECDLNEDGTYEENITADVKSADIFYGRSDETDAADDGRLTLTLDNSTGRFTPKTSSFTTGKLVRVRSTAPSSANMFTGWITNIKLSPEARRQEATIVATDALEILRRAIISQRLMQDKPTGLIIHRLIDAGERGELIANTSFDEDASGYSLVGAASTARVTTGQILEGQAALRIATTGSAQGVRYNVTSVTAGGDRVTALAYLARDTATTSALTAAVRLVDNLGTTLGNDLALTTPYATASVAGTFGGASTARYIDVIETNPSASGTWYLGALHAVLTKNAVPRSLDTGDTYLSYFGPYRIPAAEAINAVRDNELGGLFYINPSGSAVFEQRTHRWASVAAAGTISDTMHGIDYDEDFQDRFSKVELTHGDFDVGAASSYIWELELPHSRLLRAGGTVTVQAPFGHVSKDVVKPVANTDWRVNTKPDGTGSDMSGSVTLTMTPYGEGATFRLVNNNGSVDAWITQLALRATPIRQTAEEPLQEYTPASPPSIPSVLVHPYQWNDNKGDAVKGWAKHLGDHFATQRERVSVSIRPATTALLTQMLTRKVSDRVNLVNTAKDHSTKINGDYYIEAVKHRIGQGAYLHDTVWTLTPVQANTYWIVGHSTYGKAGTTTRAAP